MIKFVCQMSKTLKEKEKMPAITISSFSYKGPCLKSRHAFVKGYIHFLLSGTNAEFWSFKEHDPYETDIQKKK